MRSHSRAAVDPQLGVVAASRPRQLGGAHRAPGALHRPALLRRGAQALHVDPRSRQRVALVPALAQIAGALRDVRLDPQPGRGHASDPHHVLGAQLDAVKPVRHGGTGAGQVAAAAQALRLEGPERADPLRLGRPRDERLELLETPDGPLLLPDPERVLGVTQEPEDLLPAGEMGSDLVEVPRARRASRRSRTTCRIR